MRRTVVPASRFRSLRRVTWTLLVAAAVIPLPARSAMLVDRLTAPGPERSPRVAASAPVVPPGHLQVAVR